MDKELQETINESAQWAIEDAMAGEISEEELESRLEFLRDYDEWEDEK